MAIFHGQAKAIRRTAGRSATDAAAYRAGERIVDERTGEIHDYRKKKGIVHTQIFLPKGVRPMSRSELWNLAEHAEKRKDAKVAREWELALPAELSRLHRMYLAQQFARAIALRRGGSDMNPLAEQERRRPESSRTCPPHHPSVRTGRFWREDP